MPGPLGLSPALQVPLCAVKLQTSLGQPLGVDSCSSAPGQGLWEGGFRKDLSPEWGISPCVTGCQLVFLALLSLVFER